MSAAADRANALRWDGRAGRYEVWYLIVAGKFWLRYTLRVPTDPAEEGEAALWLVSFAGTPAARKEVFPLEAFRAPGSGWPIELGPARLCGTAAHGSLAGARWELELHGDAPPFAHTHPLVRALRVAKTQLVCSAPALAISGFVEVDGVRQALDRAPGHQAHIWGSRHAQRWGWAHANGPGGRWVEALAAKVPGAPQLALSDLTPLHEYFRSLRDVRLEITGADLAALGLGESPRVGEVLAELRRRKLNGDLDGRDSELAAAQELIAQE